MDTKRDSKQEVGNTGKDLASMAAEDKGTSRRKFTRNALVGSAVLLTLSNRSAWGAKVVVCASANLLLSYNTGQPSAMTLDQLEEINNYEHYLSEAKAEPEKIGDAMCYEINQPNNDN
jgi:hypothetical protein